MHEQRQIGILLQTDPDLGEAGPDDLYRVGTVANVLRYLTGPDEIHHVVCQGVQRMRVVDFVPDTPFLTARALDIPEAADSSPEIEARLLNLRRLSMDAVRLLPQLPRI